jgi:hypothetical protein
MDTQDFLVSIACLVVFWAPIMIYWWLKDWYETQKIRAADKHWDERNPRH